MLRVCSLSRWVLPRPVKGGSQGLRMAAARYTPEQASDKRFNALDALENAGPRQFCQCPRPLRRLAFTPFCSPQPQQALLFATERVWGARDHGQEEARSRGRSVPSRAVPWMTSSRP